MLDKAINAVVLPVLAGAYQATLFVSKYQVVRATRPFRHSRRNLRDTLVLTVGQPNYAERIFIKRCKRKHERLPTGKALIRETRPGAS